MMVLAALPKRVLIVKAIASRMWTVTASAIRLKLEVVKMRRRAITHWMLRMTTVHAVLRL